AVLGLARTPGGPRHDRDAGGIDRHRAADREVGILGAQVAAGHDEELVHVGRAGDDHLGAGDDHAARVALDDVDVGVGIGLLVRLARAIALGVGHGNAYGEVVLLH